MPTGRRNGAATGAVNGAVNGAGEHGAGDAGAALRQHRRWVDTTDVVAVPHDVPVPGAGNGVVNTLRLWEAQATDAFDLDRFNAGGYAEAVAARNEAENITMVLYPNDASENGKALRLRQQYFLVSASLQDALRIWLARGDGTLDGFAEHHVFQLNDTHPSLAVAELMRLLVDEHDLEWDAAWYTVRRTMAYTNHTLLPEALERWSLALIESLLPRPVEIIREIDRRFLAEVDARWPNDAAKLDAMAIVSRDHDPMVRMAHLAIVGSFSVNGVAELHSNLLRTGLFADFASLYPERFNNKTNGVTQRRWLEHCNPGLSALLDDAVGTGWVEDMAKLEALVPMSEDEGFRARWRDVKRVNRERLGDLLESRTGERPHPDMMIDVQVKRIHEYKRQLLCILSVVHGWLERGGGGGRLDPALRREASGIAPRCVVIAGKAAPGYHMAKAIIKVASEVARVVNADPATRDSLRFVFLPDYNVSSMQVICPGTDLSEQISTAGKEASGTGNMKFMMNGALTVGTLDGANVEILEAVGEEHFFRFGMTVDEVVGRARRLPPRADRRGRPPGRRDPGRVRRRHVRRRRARHGARGDRGDPEERRSVDDGRGPAELPRRAGRGRRRLAGPGGLDALEHRQHRDERALLDRSHDARLQPRHLAPGAAGRPRPLNASADARPGAPPGGSLPGGALEEGLPHPMGASVTPEGVNFCLFSAHATAVELCLFDAAGERETARLALPARTGDVWHGHLPGGGAGLVYGYRVHGPYAPAAGHRFNAHKLLVDPYARELRGTLDWHDAVHGYTVGHPDADLSFDARDSAPHVPKSVVRERLTRRRAEPRPPRRGRDTVVYEAHVKSLTKRLTAWTRAGAAPTRRSARARCSATSWSSASRRWSCCRCTSSSTTASSSRTGCPTTGATTRCAFSPRRRATRAGDPVREFRDMTRRLHGAGLEVWLDVVYNHTCEGNEMGPTLCYRGIDNLSYYRLPEDRRRYINDSGCGNTLAVEHPRVLQLVMDSLRFWAGEMQVDGFRFDLATILGRESHGFDPGAGFFDAVAQDPLLAPVKLVAEPWDIGPGGYQLGRYPAPWSEWNDRYRDVVRRFWLRGEPVLPALSEALLGSAATFEHGAAARRRRA